MPIKLDWSAGEIGVSGESARRLARLADFAKTFRFDPRHFAGVGQDSELIRVRWLYLRLLGCVLALTFFELWRDGPGLLGPHGLNPVDENLEWAYSINHGSLWRILAIPSLLWVSPTDTMIRITAAAGFFSGFALIFNVLPRAACFICWVCLVSFTSSGQFPLALTPDALLCEMAFLSVFFAPPGLRPGLGKSSSPTPLATIALRWLLFRLLLESGISKYAPGGDEKWRDWTFMDQLHVTSALPTLPGFFLQLAPHWFHVLEIWVMLLAEFAAPLLSFMGRAGCLAAFALIALLQLGIALGANFGHLNTMTLVLTLLLLDDRTLGLRASIEKPGVKPIAVERWSSPILIFLLAASLLTFVDCVPPFKASMPEAVERFTKLLNRLNICDVYHLYGTMPVNERMHLQIEGTNDGGKSWRVYRYRSLPQSSDETSPVIPPGHPRFDVAIHFMAIFGGQPTANAIRKLLQPGNEVVDLFRENPFPEGPPEQLRVTRFRYMMTDLATYWRSGAVWRREQVGEPLLISPAPL